jgi:hypothetical protein
MRVYHFVNERFGLEDLKKRRLKIATIEDLNDPFEMLGFSNHNPELRKGWEYSKKDADSRFGLLCFSRSWRNPVQWSHYADGHKGLCLGFDVPKRLLVEVTYSDQRWKPDLAAFREGGRSAQKELTRIFSTKFSHWRYENEVRCIIPLRVIPREGGFYFERFSHRLSLREVIVGHRSTVSRKQALSALRGLKDDVSLIKARLAFRSFSVVRQRDEALWT